MNNKIKKVLYLPIVITLAVTMSLIISESVVKFWPYAIFKFSNKNTVNMYIVGESTGFGYPYDPKISYPKILSYMLGNKVLEKDINIVNLSKPGCKSVDQYWILFRELYLRPPPKDSILLIYVGINEWTNARSNNHPLLKRFIDKSICLSRLIYLFNSGLYLDTIGYEDRLRDIIELGKKFKLYIVISSLCANYADFSPLDRSILENQNAVLLCEKAAENEQHNDLNIAANIYRNLLQDKTIAHDHVYFRLGKLLAKQGNYKEAKEYFFKAAEQNWNLKPSRYQNRVIEELSREYGIDFIDTMQVFTENSPNGMIGNNLFIDAHHPNLKGYILLAKTFAGKISDHYNIKTVKSNPTEVEVVKYFNYDPEDLLNAYVSVSGWIIAKTASYAFGVDNIDRAEYYLTSAWELYNKSNEHYNIQRLYLLQLMLAAVKGESEKTVYWLNKSDFLDKISLIKKNNKDLYNFWLKLFSGVKLPANMRAKITG